MFRNYAPTTFNELIFEDASVASRLRKYASGFKRKTLLLYGEPGTAKSLTAQIIADAVLHQTKNQRIFVFNQSPVINGADWDKACENRILNIWNNVSPYVVIDEVDELEKKQKDVTKIIDRYKDFGDFILTTNKHPNELLERLVSRCEPFYIGALSVATVFPVVRHIFDNEGLQHYSDAQIKTLIKSICINGKCDWRSIEDLVDDEIFYVQQNGATQQ